MPSPIGDRLESFPIGVALPDVDPISGRTFDKVSVWNGPTLVTTVSDPRGESDDFVTRRHIRDDGALVQVTSHAGAQFERVFERVG